jgi:hypothetical protein
MHCKLFPFSECDFGVQGDPQRTREETCKSFRKKITHRFDKLKYVL